MSDVECELCDGFGYLNVQVSDYSAFSDGVDTVTCPRCHGSGKVASARDTERPSLDVRDTQPAPPPAGCKEVA